jgi:lactate permease
MRAAVAALPIVAVLALIASRRVAAWRAAVLGAALAFLLATTVFALPLRAAISAALYGVATGLFPIVYIVAGSVFLYQLTVASGWAERLRASLVHLMEDRYLVLLLVGFGFAAFLDSTAGFLTPVTVGTALLVGLGVPAIEAAAYTLVASSLPPMFGAMGIPVLVFADVGGLPLEPLARAQANVAALLSIAFPAWLTLAFGGVAAVRRLWRPALAAGAAYAAALWWVATAVSLYPAALAASVAALAAVVVAAPSRATGAPRRGLRDVAGPWWPYAILMAAVLLWSLPPVARRLAMLAVAVPVPNLPGTAWRLDLLGSPGTAIVAAAALFAVVGRLSGRHVREAAAASARQLRLPVVNMLAMFALAQIMNASGMTHALGAAVSGTRGLFPLVSPYLSWLGAGITGSNTASNALLGRIQSVTALELGLDPILTAGLAGGAAALGKMIAPQVIAAAVGAAAIPGAEGRLLRVGLLHGALWTALLGVAGVLLAG